MTGSQVSASPLYWRVRRLRFILPITAFLLVVAHQLLFYVWLGSTPWLPQFLWQVLLYGTLGPIVVWFALTWFAQWVRERDQAEAHLQCLYRISRQAATATDMESLVDITLRMPEEVFNPVATSLILRDRPESPWTLAGTRNLGANEEETLTARLTVAGSDLYCGQCETLAAKAQHNCPLHLRPPQADVLPAATSIICLPLSTERPPLALLNVYLFSEEDLAAGTRRVLESMAAVLSVALDHARLRAREFQMLHRMEQATRQEEGLAATLEHILGDMATVHHAVAGEVFLVPEENKASNLIPIASWPENKTHPDLVAPAREALLTGDSAMTTSPQNGSHLVAVPLMAEGHTMGILVLAGQSAFNSSQRAFLQVAASTMALIIRNSQLYAELKSQAILEERNRLAREFHDGLAQSLGFLNFKMQHIDRLLARERWEPARDVLREMRQGIQDLYSEVRLTIQDLRWVPDDGHDLQEHLHQYVLDFADRTGLEVSLEVEGEPNLPPQDEVHLFRIVQEALANVHKHAQAQRAWIRLRAGADGTILEVEDDGSGMSWAGFPQDPALPDSPNHFGLRIMQERAEAIGGQLSMHGIPGRGTRLQVTICGAQAPDPYVIGTASEGK